WVLGEIEAAMKVEASTLNFEQAALYRDWLRRLERMMHKQAALAAPVLHHNAVIVLPETDGAQLTLVRYGRPVETLTLAASPVSTDVRHLRERLSTWFCGDQEEPERYFKQEIDEVRVLAHWMYVYREQARAVHWQGSLETFVADVLAEIETAQAEPVVVEEA
ncbi:MAG: hypothetical protein ACR2GR_10535, partial [Rhodothermales bacterium]